MLQASLTIIAGKAHFFLAPVSAQMGSLLFMAVTLDLSLVRG